MGQSSRIAPSNQPGWDVDYPYGQAAEINVRQLLHWIATGNGQAEVKRKRMLDLNFYVETHCDKGRRGDYAPSGISISTADVWAYVLGDTGVTVVMPIEHVRRMLDHVTTRDRAEEDGSCPTKGKLISLAALLYELKKAGSGQPVRADEIRWGNR